MMQFLGVRDNDTQRIVTWQAVGEGADADLGKIRAKNPPPRYKVKLIVAKDEATAKQLFPQFAAAPDSGGGEHEPSADVESEAAGSELRADRDDGSDRRG